MTRRNFLCVLAAAPLLAVLPRSKPAQAVLPTAVKPVRAAKRCMDRDNIIGCTFNRPLTIYTTRPVSVVDCTFNYNPALIAAGRVRYSNCACKKADGMLNIYPTVGGAR